MTENYIARVTSDFTLQGCSPDQLTQGNIRNLRLFFKDENKIVDIGSLSFKLRMKKTRPNGASEHANVLVDLSSIDNIREQRLSNLIEELKTRIEIGQIREITAFGKVRNVISFIDWCDYNNHENVMDNVKNGAKAYNEYSMHLDQLTKTSIISLHTAANYQEDALFSLTSIFNIAKNKISQGTRTIRRNSLTVKKTTPPSDGVVSDVLSLSNFFFNGACEFLLNFRKFPYKITLPKEDVWLLPTKPRTFATKEKLAARENWGLGQWAWNFELGTINCYLDISNKYNYPNQAGKNNCAKKMISNATRALSYENESSSTPTRQKIASLANKCFHVLFFANTGLNFSQARNLPWSDDYIIDSSKLSFKVVKFRAQAKDVEIVITSQFLETFKKYIQLRKYILQGHDYPYLLLVRNGYKDTPKQLPKGVLKIVTRDLRRHFYANLVSVNTREWRAKKSDFLVRTTDISTTALMLQNSERTVIRAYMEGSDQECSYELSSFWRRLSELVKFKKSDGSEEPIAIGNCKKPDSPIAESTSSPITPDCRQPEGCLFCNQYSVHADEQDLRKLHSLLYVINQCMTLAKSIEHHNSVFGEVIKRIHFILRTISGRSEYLKILNEKVENDVNVNENLSTYWESKLTMLVNIGAL